MDEIKKTEISIRADSAVGVSSSSYGANIDAIAFNLNLIAEKKPTKVPEILALYEELKDVMHDTPVQPDEDFGLANDQIKGVLDKSDD